MTRAWGSHASRSDAIPRRHRPWVATSFAGVAAALFLLGACGGDDDDASSSSSSTSPETDSSVTLATTLAPTLAPTNTTVPPTPPPSVVYVTEGASVIVVNASRIDGAAGRMSERLAAVGFATVEPGNYTLGDLELTQILQDPTNPAALAVAQSLQAALGGGDIQVLEMTAPPPVEAGDLKGATVLVAMGNDTADKTLEELQGLAPATTAPTESTTESTESSVTESTSA